MPRANKSSCDSLDLLLDTICNMFGGILFLSMLVVILLNMSSEDVDIEPVPEVTHQEMLDAQSKLIESAAELERLKRAAEQRQSTEQKLANPEVVTMLHELRQVTSLNASILRNRDDTLDQLANSQDSINNTVSEIQQLKRAHQQLADELASVDAELHREISLRTRTAELPKQRRTNKRQLAFIIKGGKFYSFAKVVDGGPNVVPNESDIKLITEGDKVYAETVSSGGVVINPESQDLTDIQRVIQQFNKDEYFLAVVVWPDSFTHFLTAKEAIIRSEFEYQLVPWSGKNKLYVGSTNERGGFVQ